MKNRVLELRIAQGLTLVLVGESSGVSRLSINAIEKEKFDPSLPTAFKMAEIFNLPIEQFFFFTKD